MQTRLVIVDDEPEMRAMLERYLSQHGYACTTVADGPGLWAALHQGPAAVVVLDLNLVAEDGLDLVRQLRAHQPDIGIIIVTARGDEADRVVGLELGADDYIAKPFSLRELAARIKTLARRVPATESPPRPAARRPVIAFAHWQFDPACGRLTDEAGSDAALTPAEFNLLSAFLAQPGKVLSREELQAALGRMGEAERTVDVQVKRLRTKIEANPRLPRIIQTVRGDGYMLAAEVMRREG